jgi:hypothetical protein
MSQTLQQARQVHLVTAVEAVEERILQADPATLPTVVVVVEPTTLTEQQERLTRLEVAAVQVVHQEPRASVVPVVQVSALSSIGLRR